MGVASSPVSRSDLIETVAYLGHSLTESQHLLVLDGSQLANGFASRTRGSLVPLRLELKCRVTSGGPHCILGTASERCKILSCVSYRNISSTLFAVWLQFGVRAVW